MIWKKSSNVDKTHLGGSERHSEDTLVSQKGRLKGKTFVFFFFYFKNRCWGQKGTVLIFCLTWNCIIYKNSSEASSPPAPSHLYHFDEFQSGGLHEKKCSSELGLGNCALTFNLTAQETNKICVCVWGGGRNRTRRLQ